MDHRTLASLQMLSQVSAVRTFAPIYPACRPHGCFCFCRRQLSRHRFDLFSNFGIGEHTDCQLSQHPRDARCTSESCCSRQAGPKINNRISQKRCGMANLLKFVEVCIREFTRVPVEANCAKPVLARHFPKRRSMFRVFDEAIRFYILAVPCRILRPFVCHSPMR